MYEYLQQVPRKPFCLICNYSWRRNASRIRTRGRRKQGSEHRPREGDQVTRRPASPRPLDPFPFLTPRISVRRNLGHCRSPGAGSVREAARNGMEWGDMGIENANLHRHRYLLVALRPHRRGPWGSRGSGGALGGFRDARRPFTAIENEEVEPWRCRLVAMLCCVSAPAKLTVYMVFSNSSM